MSMPLAANGSAATRSAAPAPFPAGMQRIVLDHEQRGISLQIALRGVLALFVVGTLLTAAAGGRRPGLRGDRRARTSSPSRC